MVELSQAVDRGLSLCEDLLALDKLADHGVVSVEDGASLAQGDLDLAPICVLTVVGEREHAALGVAQAERLVCETLSVSLDVAPAEHDAGEASSEGGALVGA